MLCDLVASNMESASVRDLADIKPGTAVKVMLVVPNRVSHIAQQALVEGESPALPQTHHLALWFRVTSKGRGPGPDGPHARWVGIYTGRVLDLATDDVWQESGMKADQEVTFCDRNIVEVGA